jgi:hypothetical protein
MLIRKKKQRTAFLIQADSNFLACWNAQNFYNLSLSTEKTIYAFLIAGGSDTHHISTMNIIILSLRFGQPQEGSS